VNSIILIHEAGPNIMSALRTSTRRRVGSLDVRRRSNGPFPTMDQAAMEGTVWTALSQLLVRVGQGFV